MKKIRCTRLVALILCAVLVLPLTTPVQVAAATDGSFGSGLSWQLKNGCLTISGSGAIPNYTDSSKSSAPWYDVRDSVTNIIIQEGITRIGDFSLFDMANVTAVTLPESLTSIGDQGMAYMRSLTALELPASLETLGPACFGNCDSLRHLYVYGYETEFVWLSYGFRYDSAVDDYVELWDVTLYGYFGSTAENYASQYENINFYPLDSGGISGTREKTEETEHTDALGAVHIYTIEEFLKIADAPHGHYILEADLILPADWVPINLSGTLDGQGHTISGLNMTTSETGHYGLFGWISGTVSNLTVEGSIDASGNDWISAGLLAGECWGVVYNCTVIGSVTAEAVGSCYAAGMAGRGGSDTVFEQCTIEVDVSVTPAATATWISVGGLCSVNIGRAVDCTYDGNLSLIQAVSAPNMGCEIRGIGAASEGGCVNCTVAGSITMSIIDPDRYALVLALSYAVNSVNTADINVTTGTYMNVIACNHTSNCVNEGNIDVTYTGTTGELKVFGFSQSANCRNSGNISATSYHTDATAYAINSNGDDSSFENSGDVSATALNGRAYAYGIGGPGSGTGSNTGAVTATASDTAYARGVTFLTSGSNSGAVTASSSEVDSTSYAYGVELRGGSGSNSGAVHAEAPKGRAYALGISGGTSCVNSGVISSSGTVWSNALGIFDCSYSKNLADIKAENYGPGEGVVYASAYGVQGGTGNENSGNISATGSARDITAVGCGGSSDSSSSGSITASGSGTVEAYGLLNCNNSFSSGTITAVCDGEKGSAKAYGYYYSDNSHSGCSSTATASATVTYFKIYYGAGNLPLAGYSFCSAGNAASASVKNPGYYHFTQNGGTTTNYYVWYTSAGVYGFYNCEPESKYRYSKVASILMEGSAVDSWTPPEAPEPEPEPTPTLGVTPEPFLAGFYYSNAPDCRIKMMTNNLGSFSFHKGTTASLTDPTSTDYSVVYLRLQYLNAGIDMTAAGTTELTLPDGFSFTQDSYEQTKTVNVAALASGEIEELWIPVYPLFSLDYSNGDQLKCSYTTNSGYERTLPTGCQVYLPSWTSGQSQVNYYFEANLNRYSYVNYQWQTRMFDQDNTLFHQNINELAALLSSIIYFTNDDPNDALEALTALGFSCLLQGGSNSVMDCRHIVAQKILLSGDGQVQQLVVLVILGTSNAAGWAGNAAFLDTQKEHASFLSSAQSAVETLNRQLDGYLENGQERKLLITGHSRGAAAANLAANLINQQYADEWTSIYAYTYATPRTSSAEQVEMLAGLNNNIFNIVNLNDVVGYVPNCYMTHGTTLFYENEIDPVVSLYIVPLRDGTSIQPLRMSSTGCYHLLTALRGVAVGGLHSKRILDNHLMNFYVEDIWGIMPEKIYTHDVAMSKMDGYYSQAIAEAAQNFVDDAVSAADYTAYLASRLGILPLAGVALAGEYAVQIPLNMMEFFRQPVMDAPLEINCPVDLKIFDESGALIGEVKDDEILSSSKDFILSVVEDKKSLLLLENKTYLIEITGYDSGTMDMQLMYHGTQETVEAISYTDVPVSPDITLVAKVENGVLTLLDNSAQTIDPKVTSGDDLQTVEVSFETNSDTVITMGEGSYIAGQQVLLTAASSDPYAIFAGWYSGDTLIAVSETACITCDSSMTLTPKYLADAEENSVLQLFRGSDSISATITCTGSAVLYAAAYDSSGKMLWVGMTDGYTGTITIPAPADVMTQADTVKVFLLEPVTLQPLCRFGN